MHRFWAFVFLLVPILGVATFIIGPYYGIDLPKDVSVHGGIIDDLFYFILWLTGVVFVGTEVLLAYFALKYSGAKKTGPVKYTHGSHTLEVVWSIIPAAILLFIAVYQIDAWKDAKMDRPTIIDEHGTEIPKPAIAEVTGRAYEWRIRYAGADGQVGTKDDIYTVNDLHLPIDEEVVIRILSEDVLHSFFLPNLRLKQDVIPGMKQNVWFKATEKGNFDIVCAELCGWGHYKMKGQLTLETRADFEKYLAEKLKEQNRHALEKPTE